MRHLCWMAGAIAAVPIALAGAPQVNASWSLSGRVVDAVSGRPIAHAPVTAALDSQPDFQFSTSTDEHGTYHFDRVRSGSYFLFARVMHLTIDPSWRHDHAPEIADGRPRTPEPAPIVDAGGRYRLALDPRSLTESVRSGSFTYATTFYPSATTTSSARRVVIDAGQPRTGVDIGLRRVPTRRVTGTVVGPPFKLPDGPGERLTLIMTDGRLQLPVASTVTQDGTFVFMSVPPGTYTIEAAEALHGDIGGTSHGRFPNAVTVGDADVSGVTVKLTVK